MNNTEAVILKKMADQSEEIFFIFSIKENRIIYLNSSFESVTKRSNHDFTGDPSSLLRIVHKEDLEYVEKRFNSLVKKKSNSLMDFRILRPDNTERWMRVKINPVIENEEVQYLSGVAEDDSARKASIFNMQKVNGWKDSILDILSHDLRGLIGIVKLLASAISSKLAKNENKQIHDWTETILNISQRNLELIKNILTRETLVRPA